MAFYSENSKEAAERLERAMEEACKGADEKRADGRENVTDSTEVKES